MTRSMFAGIFVANEAVGEISAVIQSLGLPYFPRRNTEDTIHLSPVRPMCRYIIPCILPSGHKFHTSSEHC